MKKNQQKIIDELNNLSIISYLKILGNQPSAEFKNSTEFKLALERPNLTTIIVDHDTNVFIDRENRRKGTLADLIYLMFGIPTTELLEDIVPYRIDLLIAESEGVTVNRS